MLVNYDPASSWQLNEFHNPDEWNRAFPFFYRLVQTDRLKDSTASPNEQIGQVVSPGGVTRFYVKMDSDFNYLLKNIRISASSFSDGFGGYIWHDGLLQTTRGANEPYPYRPFEAACKIRLYIPSSDARETIGGNFQDPTGLAGTLQRANAINIHNTRDGYGGLETPYMVARAGVVVVEVENTLSGTSFSVDGHLFGYKVR